MQFPILCFILLSVTSFPGIDVFDLYESCILLPMANWRA